MFVNWRDNGLKTSLNHKHTCPFNLRIIAIGQQYSQVNVIVAGVIFEAPAEGDLQGNDIKLRQCNVRLLRKKAAFSVRLLILWNKLPIEIINAATHETFKRL